MSNRLLTDQVPDSGSKKYTLAALARPGVLRVVAVLAGALLPLAFAPFEWRILALLSPAVLFWLWQQGSVREVTLRSFLFGFGLFGTGTYWIYHSLHLFGDAIAPLALVITVGFICFFATYIAAFGYVSVRFFRKRPGSKPDGVWLILLAPALWTLGELFRGWFLTGFPWLSLGYSQIDSPLSGYAPVLGVYGVSWLTATSGGCLLALCACRNRVRFAAGALLLAIWGGGLALAQIEWSHPVGEPLRVRMVQGNIEQYHKFMADLLQPSIETYKRLSASPEPVDLVIWPESAIPTFFYKIDKELATFSARMRKNNTRVITGGFTYDRANDVYYNSLRMLDDSTAYYHKQHLVPFGEFLPFRPLLAFLTRYITIPMSDLSSGPFLKPQITVKGQRIGASICYEDAFGEEIIRQLPEANMLLNISNDSWFGDSIAPYQHLEIARMRALETARPMVRVTNTGVSAAFDYRGKIRALLDRSKAAALSLEIQPREGNSYYVSLGNQLILGLLLIVLFFSWLIVGSSSQRKRS